MKIITKTMTMLLILFFLSVLLNAGLAQNTSAQLTDMEKTIQEMMEEGDIPGLSIVMIKGDNQVLIKNLGYAHQEKEVPVTSDTLFELGSCSKSFTALAALHLVEQGSINLDDPVSKYFPDFFVQYEGQPYQLTIRQLLHHTGGIPWSSISLIPKGSDKDALEQTVKRISGIELKHIPGQQFEYATVNYDIVGAIIEKVSQKSFEDYMHQYILKPLGLNDTFVGVVPGRSAKAKGYKIGFFSPRAYTPPVYRGNNPAAYVSCNAKDMAKWLKIQMGLVETGFTPLIRKTHQYDRNAASGTPNPSSYAMGWFISLVGEKQIYHGGLNPNFSAYVGFQPEKKIGVAVLTNSNSNSTPYIGDYILRTLSGEKNVDTYVPDNGLDRTASTISFILAALLISSVVYLFLIIMGIFKGKRKYTPLTLKRGSQVIGGLLATAPILIGVYLLPRALANVSWETAVVWAPISFTAAAILFLAVLGAGVIVSLLSLLFPHKNKLKQILPFTAVLSTISGVGVAATIFLVILTFSKTVKTEYILYYFALTLFVTMTSAKIAQTKLIKIANDFVYDFRIKLINKLFSTIFRKFENLDTGQIYATVNNDTETLGNSPNIFVSLITNIVVIISIFVYLGILAFVPTLITLLTIFLIAVFYSLVSKGSQILMEKARDTQNVFMKLVDGLVKGYKELIIHRNMRDEYGNELENTCSEYREKRNVALVKFVNVQLISNAMLIILMIVISIGFDKIFPNIQVSTLVSFIIIFVYAIGPIVNLLGAIPTAVQIRVAWNRIQTFIKETPEYQTPINEKEPIPHKSIVENLEVKNIKFEYEGKNGHDKFVLGPLDFEINKGDIIFIVGGNGSGKTTLAKILTGLYIPDKGCVKIEGKEIDNRQLGEYFSVVFSDFHLFEKLYNVNLENREQEIKEYLRILELEGKVQLKDGAFSTIDLSGGQRKRLALLKCYLEDYPIYLFDEWAAGQDPEFRKFFYRTLLAKMKEQGKIVIAITHDDHYFDVADKIIKLEVGKIDLIENGQHRGLKAA